MSSHASVCSSQILHQLTFQLPHSNHCDHSDCLGVEVENIAFSWLVLLSIHSLSPDLLLPHPSHYSAVYLPTLQVRPTLIISCYKLGSDYFLLEELSEECFTPGSLHFKFMLALGIPGILFWIIGFPAFIWAMLWEKKPYLNN